ncbi:Kelch repeat-containing protein [Crateriforma conspicua]|uniref:Kelch repeat-containing protein n=1 Tax=Crateriforma conspicua TaxID=2527996 RepID=UPI00118CD9DC|nr:kelch repeat-containing protein [Crateriforma conspicua]QDV61184.1 N-acetylneuraminate epimerase [Crateriforma conspicua]
MKSNHHPKSFLLIGCCLFIAALHGCGVVNAESPWQWETVQAEGQPTARHEAALAAYDGKVFLIGGRRINPVDVFDPATRRWTAMSPTPMELHHFQAVVVGDVIYLMGAMTGRYPGETPLERVVAYYPKEDEFRFLHPIPTARRRGGAGAVYYNGKIYLVGGITNGHIDGFQPWLDSYDPETGDWETLPDAPHARDHFQAVVCNNRLYAIGGRTTHQREKNVFGLTVDQADVFDFKTMSWLPPDQCPNLPTPRAGNMAMTWGDQVLVGGGESGDQKTAHDEVEAWDTGQQKWSDWPSMNRGRHGSGFVEADGFLYTASGSGNRGGGPELTSIERLRLP